MFDIWEGPFTFDPTVGGIIPSNTNGTVVIQIRGFGFLVGNGGFKMSEEKAMEAQEKFGKKLTVVLNMEWEEKIKRDLEASFD